MATAPPSRSNASQLAQLVQRHQAMVAVQRNAFTLRMHRALSWLQRAVDEKTDDDVAFMCLWIAFNAAYAQDNGSHTDNASERQTFRSFVAEACRLDIDKALPALVWQVFPGPIRVLLDNQYLFQPFWEALNNPRPDGTTPSPSFDEALRVQKVLRAVEQSASADSRWQHV